MIGWICWASGAIAVLPGWPVQTKIAVRQAIAHLTATPTHALYMSIEGVRSPTGQLSPYRHGCARIAIASNATLVPFVVYGARECMPRGRWWPLAHPCRVEILPMIPTRGCSSSDALALTHRLRAMAEAELRRFSVEQ